MANGMHVLSSLSVLLIVLQAATPTDLHIRVPQTSSAVMIDGVFSQGEWQNAISVDVPGTAKLYFQRSGDFVYIAVQYTTSASGIVDLYLSPREGEVYDLHASAKLGERQLRGNTFSDWNWWNNRDWIANISHVDSFEKRTFYLPQSANIRSGIHVLPPALGVCVLSSQPWEPTTKRNRTPFFRVVQPTSQLLAGCG